MKHREHRGISFGTVFMTVLTVLVLVGCAAIMPRLMGTANLRMDPSTVLSVLNLADALPELSLSDIPITDATAVPVMDVTQEPAATPVPETQQPPAETTAVPVRRVTMTLGGSISIDDNIRKSAYYSDSGKYDFSEILSLVEDEFVPGLTMVTLENLTDGNEKVSALNAPETIMDALSRNGVNVLGLGFAKAYDKGGESLTATIDAARRRGLTTVGAYSSQQDAQALRMLSIDGVKVAILHYTESITSAGKKGIKADNTAFSLPVMLVNDSSASVVADIQRARSEGAEIVIVSLNWSGMSNFRITTKLKEYVQTLADAGADIIVGSGTKAVQEVTWLTGKRPDGTMSQTLCAWSLGSLVNGERNDGNVAGMLLQLQIACNGSSVSFERVSCTPTYIWRYKQDNVYQYRVVASDQVPPDGMSDDHVGYMSKALKNIQKVIADSPVSIRTK